MPLTFSGVLVRKDSGVPSIRDIGLALSRMPRFAGHTRRWFSVLDHSLFVERMAYNDRGRAGIRLAMLLHDAHEALTGDVASDMKPDTLRNTQSWLDVRIMDTYYPGSHRAYCEHREVVKVLDHRALAAEAITIGPPEFSNWSPEKWREEMPGIPLPNARDCQLLRDLIGFGQLSRPDLLADGEMSRQIRDFERCYNSLRDLAQAQRAA